MVPGRTTSTATAHLDEQHAATYDFDLVWDLPAQDLPEDLLGLHVGSLGASLRPGRAAVVDLVRRAVEADGFVSYDPNIRPAFLDDREAAWADVVEIARLARLVKLSDEDLRLLRPDAAEEDVCRELLAGTDTELVILTRGAEGAVAFTDGATLPGARTADRPGRLGRRRRLVHGRDARDARATGAWSPTARAPCARSTTTGSGCWSRAPRRPPR